MLAVDVVAEAEADSKLNSSAPGAGGVRGRGEGDLAKPVLERVGISLGPLWVYTARLDGWEVGSSRCWRGMPVRSVVDRSGRRFDMSCAASSSHLGLDRKETNPETNETWQYVMYPGIHIQIPFSHLTEKMVSPEEGTEGYRAAR